MGLMHREKLLEYLEGFLTPEKKELFEQVLTYRTRHFTVALEDIYQEHNAGAIIRTCDCFGIQDMHVVETNYRHRVARNIARGAEKWVDLKIYDQYEDNTQQCIDTLRQAGYSIVATTPHENDCLVNDFDISQRSAFFLGAEKYGISEQVKSQADAFIKVPIVGFTESFNVSVAAALILHTLTQKLYPREDIPWQLRPEEILEIKIDWTTKSVRSGPKLVQYFYENILGSA